MILIIFMDNIYLIIFDHFLFFSWRLLALFSWRLLFFKMILIVKFMSMFNNIVMIMLHWAFQRQFCACTSH